MKFFFSLWLHVRTFAHFLICSFSNVAPSILYKIPQNVFIKIHSYYNLRYILPFIHIYIYGTYIQVRIHICTCKYSIANI